MTSSWEFPQSPAIPMNPYLKLMRCQGYNPVRQTRFKSDTSKSDATTQIDDLTGNAQPTPSY